MSYFLAGLLENRPNRESEQTDRASCRTARFVIRKALDDTDRQLLLDILGVTWQDASPGPLRTPTDLPSSELSKNCAKCRELKPLTQFHRDSHNSCGFNSYCKPCRRAAGAEWRLNREEVTPAKKACSQCGRVKRASEFHRDPGPRTGLRASCKRCTNAARRGTRTKTSISAGQSDARPNRKAQAA